LNLAIGYSKDSLEKSAKQSNPETSFTYFLQIGVINIVNALIVSMINFLMGRIVRYLTFFERHKSYTDHNLSVAMKLTFAMFVNTGLIPLFVNYNVNSWFTNTGLVSDIFFNLMAVSFFGPITYILTPEYILKYFRKKREEKKGTNSKINQRQLNELYEGQKVDIAQRYSVTMNMIMI
jgi:hypothetical protein